MNKEQRAERNITQEAYNTKRWHSLLHAAHHIKRCRECLLQYHLVPLTEAQSVYLNELEAYVDWEMKKLEKIMDTQW